MAKTAEDARRVTKVAARRAAVHVPAGLLGICLSTTAFYSNGGPSAGAPLTASAFALTAALLPAQ